MSVRNTLVMLALAGGIAAPGQSGFIIHLDSVQAGRNGSGRSVREVDDGYLVFSGQFAQEFPWRSRIYVRKLSSTGAYIHEREYLVGEDRDFDIGYIDAVASNPDGTITTGFKRGYGYDGESWLYRFDQHGDTISKRLMLTYSPIDSIAHAIRQCSRTNDGGYVLCGFHNRPQSSTRLLLVRTDPQGDTLWTRRIGNFGESTVALGVEEYPDGGFLVTGYRLGGSPINRSFLIRLTSQGFFMWRRDFGNGTGGNASVRIAEDGGILTWTSYSEPQWPNGVKEMMLTKWDPEGEIVWQRKVNYSYFCATWDMEVLDDGSIIGTGCNLDQGMLVKFNSAGEHLWNRHYTVLGGLHLLYDVEPTSDGGFVCTGYANRSLPDDVGVQTSQVIWVLKTDSLGCVVPGCQNVGVDEFSLDLNEHLHVWPNPVASGTPLSLSFTPPPEFAAKGPLRVVVLDAAGRLVWEENFTTHNSQITLHTALTRGTYHLHLRDDHRWLAGRTVVVE